MTPPLSWRLVAAVAAGGALGAAARYGLAQAWPAPAHGFPLATFVTNVSGCLAAGLLLGVERGPLLRAFAGTGLLGGFTTYSTFAVQADQLWLTGHHWVAAVSVAATLACAFPAARLGVLLARRWA